MDRENEYDLYLRGYFITSGSISKYILIVLTALLFLSPFPSSQVNHNEMDEISK